MKLDPETIRKLAKLTLETKPEEITCDDWVHRVGEYVEAKRSGDDLEERLRVVEDHASSCKSCNEELEALRGLLDDDGGTGGA